MNPRNDDNPRLPEPEVPEEWEPEYRQWLDELDKEQRDDDTH